MQDKDFSRAMATEAADVIVDGAHKVLPLKTGASLLCTADSPQLPVDLPQALYQGWGPMEVCPKADAPRDSLRLDPPVASLRAGQHSTGCPQAVMAVLTQWRTPQHPHSWTESKGMLIGMQIIPVVLMCLMVTPAWRVPPICVRHRMTYISHARMPKSIWTWGIRAAPRTGTRSRCQASDG